MGFQFQGSPPHKIIPPSSVKISETSTIQILDEKDRNKSLLEIDAKFVVNKDAYGLRFEVNAPAKKRLDDGRILEEPLLVDRNMLQDRKNRCRELQNRVEEGLQKIDAGIKNLTKELQNLRKDNEYKKRKQEQLKEKQDQRKKQLDWMEFEVNDEKWCKQMMILLDELERNCHIDYRIYAEIDGQRIDLVRSFVPTDK